MSMEGMRLLSPLQRRIYPNPRSNAGTGIADPVTWSSLVRAGWTEYFGSATTDGRGWVVAGSDPRVVPAPERRRPR